MSRIGKRPIPVPKGVEVQLESLPVEGTRVTVKGPKGTLTRVLRPDVTVVREEDGLLIERRGDDKVSRSLHGLSRTLVANMVTGVTSGFTKSLEIVGVGYRASVEGRNLVMALGYSHPVVVEPPQGISFTVDTKANRVTVEGIDKQLVGDVAADVRFRRPPEPYKGKGVKYEGEVIRRKVGKAGGKKK
ncbi:MAG: 50S ribosomal protein L6 [Candidatus Sericytochromatia bacterium]|jgi:large subunit ribosomal protein L6|nr:50S ribosomal protein L6 [Candidatus Sericytochromatia bacterium]